MLRHELGPEQIPRSQGNNRRIGQNAYPVFRLDDSPQSLPMLPEHTPLLSQVSGVVTPVQTRADHRCLNLLHPPTFLGRNCLDPPSTVPTPSHLTAASEVSSILEGRIAGTNVGGDVQETGRVLSECMANPNLVLP